MLKNLIFTVLILTFSFPTLAKIYEINGQHSFVNFELDYMKVSRVKGAFEQFQGSFEWDEKNKKLSEVVFEIKVKSINTRDPKRDNHLKRKDFFYTEKFPKISFVGEEVIYKKGVPEAISGILTIRGVKRKHSFNLKWKGEFPDPVDKNKRSLFLSATTKINRTDYDIRWNKALDLGGWVVGDDVDVEIIIEANPTDARPAFSRFYRKKTELLPGKLKAPEPQASDIILKDGTQVESNENKSSQVTNEKIALGGLSLLLGFVLFCALCVAGYYFKSILQDKFEKKLSPLWSELLSDTLLFSFLFGAAYFLAPLMGYKRFF